MATSAPGEFRDLDIIIIIFWITHCKNIHSKHKNKCLYYYWYKLAKALCFELFLCLYFLGLPSQLKTRLYNLPGHFLFPLFIEPVAYTGLAPYMSINSTPNIIPCLF